MANGLEISGYSNHSIVGRGGFGTVFRARQDAFGRDVAIKVFDARAEDGDDIAAFERECRALGALDSSPNIITVYHAGFSESSEPYIVMEFAPGGSLGQRLREHGPLPSNEVTLIGIKVANALAVAHKGGVIHRDVKPSNILIGHDGGLLLADFGIASMAGGTRTATGNLSTTLEHAAPEVLNGERPTARSDIYSLGSTLFTLLYGTPPFAGKSGDSLVAIITRVLTGDLPDLRSRGIDDSLAIVIETALDRDPNRRYENVKDFAEALEALQSASHTVSSAPQTISEVTLPAIALKPETELVAEGSGVTTMLSGVTRVIAPGENPTGVTPKKSSRRLITVAIGVAILLIGGGVYAMQGSGDSKPTRQSASKEITPTTGGNGGGTPTTTGVAQPSTTSSQPVTTRSSPRVIATLPTAVPATGVSGISVNPYRLVNGYRIEVYANLTGANLSGANLSGADLYFCWCVGADLSNADLTGANLTGANLTSANLTGANLTGANLTGANLEYANLTDATCPNGARAVGRVC